MTKNIKYKKSQISVNSTKPKARVLFSADESKSDFKKINFVRNLLLLAICLAITTILMKENQGYSWVWNDLIHENLKFIKSSSKLSQTQKYQAKFGLDAAVIDYIKSNTPDTAVILMPPSKILLSDSNYQFLTGLGGIKSKIWTMYFLYPRQLIYESDKPLPKPNYVFCFNKWGYDQLNYTVTNRQAYEVLPINY
jgi:hypothetical protein